MHLQFAELPVFDQDRAMAFYTECSPMPTPHCTSSAARATRLQLGRFRSWSPPTSRQPFRHYANGVFRSSPSRQSRRSSPATR